MAAKERFLNDEKYYNMRYFSRCVLYTCVYDARTTFIRGETMPKLSINYEINDKEKKIFVKIVVL